MEEILVQKGEESNLQSSLNQGGREASEHGDVSGVAGLTNPFFQLVEKDQLVPVYSSF